MQLNFCLLLLLIGLCLCATDSKNNKEESADDDELFVPTREWQVVKKSQKIPKGLHVRVNLETGLTEAKLLDENETEKTSAVAEIPQTNDDEVRNSNSDSAGRLKLSEAELKEALKNIKSDYMSDKEKDKITKKFRSYEELKKELGDINLTPKTDAELIRELMDKHKTTNDVSRILTILTDLEFLVHQYDNANEFVNLNGFKEIIFKNLNSSNVNIKRESLKLLGSAVQNNAKVQIHALEMGSIGVLIKQLALDTDYSIKNRAIFALSGILRHFPIAQLKFIENAGLSVFADELAKQKNMKIQLKIVTLINDLLLEHKYVMEDNTTTNYKEKLRQYNQVNMKEKLKKHNWCDYVNNVFQNVFEIDINDHDSIEKCLNAIISIMDTCNVIISTNIKDTVIKLQSRYKHLILTEDKNEDEKDETIFNYYTHLLILCRQIIEYFNYKYKFEL
ncbi:hypothetical protein ILUMI_21732 [Ignelater luminosus]|uniref:Nucleotide exchange factor SIL1 n=1 Tax=Ignelater luminosus TaxID=2038154 RepID=A0A8K0CE08_IGNLU|nr:hypothetical protein ILUMI_21732 [Ignelater luminosus]